MSSKIQYRRHSESFKNIQYPQQNRRQKDYVTDEKEEHESTFECNICLDQAKDPVVTLCGHLYCWPCLYQWINIKHTCPVCKSTILNENIIPLYGRGSTVERDLRREAPPRPEGHRTEPRPNLFIPGFGNGLHITLELGHFLFEFFTVFTLMQNLNLMQQQHQHHQAREPALFRERTRSRRSGNFIVRLFKEVISNIFLWMAIIFILFLFTFSI